METSENNWTVGEVVTLPREEKSLKKIGTTLYERCIDARYICIREAAEGKRGILMKVLGKIYVDQIKMVGGEPFCKDDREDTFVGVRYFSYSFPTAAEVMEALGIIRGNQSLLQKFDDAAMHVNPDSTFWVRDTTRSMLFMKKAQYIGGRNGQLYSARSDGNHYRVTFVYFYKNALSW